MIHSFWIILLAVLKVICFDISHLHPSVMMLVRSSPRMKISTIGYRLCRSSQQHLRNSKKCIHNGSPVMSCEFYCPDPERPFPKTIHHFDTNSIRQLSATSNPKEFPMKYPPQICHIATDKEWRSIVDLIVNETNLPPSYILELIEFGSVFMSKQEPEYQYPSIRTPGGILNRRVIVNQRVERITSLASLDGITISSGTYIRVHINQSRYYGGYGITWSNRVWRPSLCPGSMLIVDKPCDLPTIETTSTRQENLAYDVAKFIGRDPITSPLHAVSRLDACTSGLVPMALNSRAAAILCKIIADQEVKKVYKVLVHAKGQIKRDSFNFPQGNIKHCFRRLLPQTKSKKPTLLKAYDPALLAQSELSLKTNVSFGRKWQLAEMNILSSVEVNRSDLDLTALVWNHELNGTTPRDPVEVQAEGAYFECLIELVTGRTHQIRLQLAA